MRRRNNLLLLHMFLVGFFLIAGKGWSAGPADTKAAQTAAAIPQTAYTFNPAGKPDPFKPFVEAELAFRKRMELETKKKQPLSPLQRAEVESYKLLGIAGGNTKRTALVQDAAGKSYALSIGTHIGLHNGKVVDIRSDRVVVEEPSLKKTKGRKIEMKLRREGEGGRP